MLGYSKLKTQNYALVLYEVQNCRHEFSQSAVFSTSFHGKPDENTILA